jgi:hypothetical protein
MLLVLFAIAVIFGKSFTVIAIHSKIRLVVLRFALGYAFARLLPDYCL